MSDFPRKSILLYDEASSYISSSAGISALRTALAETDDVPRQWTNQWTTASDWRSLIDPTLASRSSIADELSKYDVHPPLFFYALNFAQRMIGVENWAGTALNLSIFAISICAFVALASVVLQRPIDALAATALWALNPHSVVVSFLIRPYELLTLFTVLIAWRALLLSDPNRRTSSRDWIWVVVLTAFGLLTHYQFVIPLGAAAILVLTCVVTKDPGRIWKSVLAVLVGVAVFCLAYPEVTSLFSSYGMQIEHSSQMETPDPVLWTLTTILQFYKPMAGSLGLSILFGWVAILCAALIARGIAGDRAPFPRNTREGKVVILLAIIGGVIIGAFISGLTPAHAMGPQYLSMVWPLLAIATVIAFRQAHPSPKVSVALLVFSVAVFSFSHLENRAKYDRASSASVAAFAWAERIVVATPREVVLTRLLFAAEKDALFYVATSPELVAVRDSWLNSLKPGDIVAFDGVVDTKTVSREKLFSLVAEKYDLDQLTISNGYNIGVLKRRTPG